MKFMIFFVLSIFSILLIHCNERPLDVDQIIEKHIKVMGGEEILKHVSTLKLTGTFIWAGREHDLKCYIKSPNHYRMEFMNFRLMFDGDDLWRMPERKGAAPKKTDTSSLTWLEFATFFQINADIEGPLLGYKEKGHTVELLGKTEVDGEQYYELKIIRNNGLTEHWYIDCETYLVTIKSYTVVYENKGASFDSLTIKVYYSDYKPVDGLTFPHYNERTARIFHFAQIIEQVELNVPLDERLFSVTPQ